MVWQCWCLCAVVRGGDGGGREGMRVSEGGMVGEGGAGNL